MIYNKNKALRNTNAHYKNHFYMHLFYHNCFYHNHNLLLLLSLAKPNIVIIVCRHLKIASHAPSGKRGINSMR